MVVVAQERRLIQKHKKENKKPQISEDQKLVIFFDTKHFSGAESSIWLIRSIHGTDSDSKKFDRLPQ